MGDRTKLGDLLAELVFGVHFQLLARQQFTPEQALGLDLAVGAAFNKGRLDVAAVRVVAFEVQGVDDDAFDFARGAQRDDDPVVARRAAAGGFPTVAHVDAATRVEDVAHATEMLIGAGQCAAAIECRGQVELLVVANRAPVAVRNAVHAQTGDAAVRVDIEAQVADRLVERDLVVVMAVALQLYRRKDFSPLGGVVRVAFGEEAGFQRGGGREVAGEEAGVDVDALDRAGDAEANDRVVVAFEALAARLPAVHPLAVVIENALLPYGRRRLEQPVDVGEPVVGDGDGLGAQAGVGQVDVFFERYGVAFHTLFFSSCRLMVLAYIACRRNRAILLISARARANSCSCELFMRSSKAARIWCRLLPLTAMMKMKPNLAL